MPATKDPAAAPPSQVIPTRPLILYAEHNCIIKQTVRDVLELAGFDVEDCADGVYARAMLETMTQRRKTYDLLLLGQELPGVAGLELVHHARSLKHFERTPIILLSFEDRAVEARASGADAFLQKPNNLLGLVEAVRRLLHGRQKAKVERARPRH